MKASVERLLEPVSPDNPCGEDIGYDPQFIELDTMMQGKPETQFAAAEEPDWRAVREQCIALAGRSKDLRVMLRLALALLRTDGLPGFRDGLRLVHHLIEQQWEGFFPRLDPDDGNDPLERVNILASLATPEGTFGDPFRFIGRVRQAPLADSPQLGKISLADIERANSGGGGEGGDAPAVSASEILGAFRSSTPEKLREIYDAVVEGQALIGQIDESLTKAVGAGRAVSFESLAAVFKELQKAIAPHAAPEEAAAAEGEPASAAAAGAAAGPAISGAIRSTQDVVRVLDQICDFYRKTEPSSPVPLILQRARRLVNLDFVQLLNDLAPDSLGQINMIAGIRNDSQQGT